MRSTAQPPLLLQRFLNWWLTELWTTVPSPVRRLLAKRRSALVIAFGEDGMNLLREAGGQSTFLLRIDPTRPATATANWRQPVLPRRRIGLRRGREERARVRVRLAAQEALRTSLSLPEATEENLSEVLGLELDRRTPFRADDVHFAYRLEERDSFAKLLKIALTVVPRRSVEAALEAVHQCGFEPSSVEVARDDGSAADPLPLHGTTHNQTRRVGTAVRLAIAVLFLTSAAAYAMSRGDTDERETLSRKVDASRAVALKVQQLKESIASLEDEKAKAARDAGRLRVNEWLNELTRLLPDDTWLDRLGLSVKKVTLSGHSGSSSNVIRILEQSRLVSSPAFGSPVTQDAETGKDEFTITAEVRRDER